MSWAEFHQKSERLAAEASSLPAEERERARDLYIEAAKLETLALTEVPSTKRRTWDVTAVSAVALWFKAGQFGEAQKLALRVANESLPPFAAQQLRELLLSENE